MGHHRTTLFAGFAITLAGTLTAAGLVFAAEPSELEFAVAEQRTIDREYIADGVVEAVNQSTVSAQIAGRIEEIYFDVDDYVPQGSVIIRFRSPEQRASVDQAQAALREAEARYKDAQTELDRVRTMYERKIMAKAALDKAEAEHKATAARVQRERAQLAQSKTQLEYTLVRAPYSGIVTKRFVEVGETATVGQPLMSGLSLEELRVAVSVPQSLMETIRTQNRARILLADGSVKAQSLGFFPYADTESHTFTVRVQLPPDVPGLYPGMWMKVAFVTGTTEGLFVPARAVVRRSEVTGIYVIDKEQHVTLRQIRIGNPRDTDIEVLAGLEPGEHVALDPLAAAMVLKEHAAPGLP